VPDRIKLPTDEDVEISEIRVLNCEVVEIELMIGSSDVVNSGSKGSHHRVRALELRQSRGHALHDRRVDFGHVFREMLVHFDDVDFLTIQRIFDILVESKFGSRHQHIEVQNVRP
jgi:hypothetical protein